MTKSVYLQASDVFGMEPKKDNMRNRKNKEFADYIAHRKSNINAIKSFIALGVSRERIIELIEDKSLVNLVCNGSVDSFKLKRKNVYKGV